MMRQSVDLRDAQAKVSELQALADAWEQEARSQSRRNMELQQAYQDFAQVQKERERFEKVWGSI